MKTQQSYKSHMIFLCHHRRQAPLQIRHGRVRLMPLQVAAWFPAFREWLQDCVNLDSGKPDEEQLFDSLVAKFNCPTILQTLFY